MDDHGYQGTRTLDGIHPQVPYPSNQGHQVQQRVYHLHRIANDHECATATVASDSKSRKWVGSTVGAVKEQEMCSLEVVYAGSGA